MATTTARTAAELRESFRAISKELRDANQSFSIRIWRGLSWLERSEACAAASDVDGQFIAQWITFNAVYGTLQECGLNAPDHANWQSFLAEIVKADGYDALGKLLWDQQLAILRLVDNRYLFRPFWLGLDDAAGKLQKSRRAAMAAYQARNVLGVLQELFERLYVMRQQVFHGAATSGSKLNRPCLKSCAKLLSAILPAMLEIMIAAGPQKDWGEVCFPPTKN